MKQDIYSNSNLQNKKKNTPMKSKLIPASERNPRQIAENREKRIREQKRLQLKKRRRKVFLVYAISTFIILFATAFILTNLISDKENLREKGITSFDNGNYTEAVDYFKKSLAEHQWFSAKLDDDTNLYLADSYMKLNLYQDAHDVYVALQTKSTNAVDAGYLVEQEHLSEALIDVENGDYEDAIKFLSEAVSGGHVEMNLYLGACYQKTGDEEKMVNCYNDYLASNPINTYIAYQFSSFYLENFDYDTAKEFIDKGLNCNDTEYKDMLLYNEIVYYEKIFDYQTAFNKATEFIAAYPDSKQGNDEYTFLYTRINVNDEPVHKPETETEAGTVPVAQ